MVVAVVTTMRTPFQTPLDDDVTREARNQPNRVQVYGDDNGHDSDADDNGGTAAYCAVCVRARA